MDGWIYLHFYEINSPASPRLMHCFAFVFVCSDAVMANKRNLLCMVISTRNYGKLVIFEVKFMLNCVVWTIFSFCAFLAASVWEFTICGIFLDIIIKSLCSCNKLSTGLPGLCLFTCQWQFDLYLDWTMCVDLLTEDLL